MGRLGLILTYGYLISHLIQKLGVKEWLIPTLFIGVFIASVMNVEQVAASAVPEVSDFFLCFSARLFVRGDQEFSGYRLAKEISADELGP